METARPDGRTSVEVVSAPPHTDEAFLFGTRDNFSMLVDRVHLAVIEGRPCKAEHFPHPDEERQWLRWQLLFQRQVLERLERYVQLRLAELDAKCPPDQESL